MWVDWPLTLEYDVPDTDPHVPRRHTFRVLDLGPGTFLGAPVFFWDRSIVVPSNTMRLRVRSGCSISLTMRHQSVHWCPDRTDYIIGPSKWGQDPLCVFPPSTRYSYHHSYWGRTESTSTQGEGSLRSVGKSNLSSREEDLRRWGRN